MLPKRSAARQPRSSTLFLCGGGTGGHVYPALAVAAALAQGSGARGQGSEAETSESADVALIPDPRSPTPRLVYVGSQDGMEAGLVSKESNLRFEAIPAAALRG